MIELGQVFTLRQVSNAHRAMTVSFRAERLRTRLSETGFVERDVVLELALACTNFSDIYITDGGEFELVWYARPDIAWIQACVRWPGESGIPSVAAQVSPSISGPPPGISPVGVTVTAVRHAWRIGTLIIGAAPVYAAMSLAGMSELAAISHIIHQDYPSTVIACESRDRDFAIVNYYRHGNSNSYRVDYGWIAAQSRATPARAEEGLLVMRCQDFSREFVEETFPNQSETKVRVALASFCQRHDPSYQAYENCIYDGQNYRWRVTYSITGPPANVAPPDMDVERAIRRERANLSLGQLEPNLEHIQRADELRRRRAERFREDTRAEQEEEYRRRMELSREQEKRDREAFKLAQECVAKEKQVAQNKSGLRAPRPNIISDDDSED